MMEIVDFYRILQVDPQAEPEVIQAAHRTLARNFFVRSPQRCCSPASRYRSRRNRRPPEPAAVAFTIEAPLSVAEWQHSGAARTQSSSCFPRTRMETP